MPFHSAINFQASTGLICSQPNPLRSSLESSVDFLHNYRLLPWQPQNHVTTLLPPPPPGDQEQPLMGNTHRPVTRTLCRWPPCLETSYCFCTDARSPHPPDFRDLLKQFGFALKQFHICLCLFGRKKGYYFRGVGGKERGVKLDGWRQMGSHRGEAMLSADGYLPIILPDTMPATMALKF